MPHERAEQVEAFRAGMSDMPDLLGSWAGLFDFTPGAWDGADPVDLPVGEDRLATLAEVGPAVASASAGDQQGFEPEPFTQRARRTLRGIAAGERAGLHAVDPHVAHPAYDDAGARGGGDGLDYFCACYRA